MSGKFIVFEGIDGAGKSTQVALLSERLRALGNEVHLTAEPTSAASGKAIREALSGSVRKSECEMATMFVLDRIAHSKDEISPLCESGKTIISDRYYYSTLAYQGQTTSYEWVKTMNLGCPEIKRPDLCIYLDLLPEQSLARINARNESLEIYENIEKLTNVRRAFLSVIDDLKKEGDKIFIVSADRAPEDIADEIFNIVKAELL